MGLGGMLAAIPREHADWNFCIGIYSVIDDSISWFIIEENVSRDIYEGAHLIEFVGKNNFYTVKNLRGEL